MTKVEAKRIAFAAVAVDIQHNDIPGWILTNGEDNPRPEADVQRLIAAWKALGQEMHQHAGQDAINWHLSR